MPKLSAALAAALIFAASTTLGAPASAAGSRVIQRAPVPQTIVAAPGALGDATSAPGWLQFGFDAGHSGDNPRETTISPQNVSGLQLLWNNANIVQPNGIVAGRGIAYITDLGQSAAGLYAVETATGKKKWFAQVNLNGPWGSFNPVPAVAGGVVVSPCSDGQSDFSTGLCGVSAATGKILWKQYCTKYNGSPCSGIVNGGTSPTVYQNRIFFQNVEGVNEQPDTQALDPQTGKVLWDVPGVYHCPDGGGGNNALPAANGLVYAVLACQGPSGATEICAFSAASGAGAWCDTTQNIYVDDMIAEDGKLFAIEAVNNGNNLAVIAVDGKTGSAQWTAMLPGANGATLGYADKRVFVNDGGRGVYAVSATTGHALWSYTANANYTLGGVVSIANGVVYTDGGGGNNGNDAITALDEKTGALISETSTYGNGGARATPVILDGTVYAGCYTLCAFRLPGSRPH